MSDSSSSNEAFVLLLTQHQEVLFRYIFSLVPVEADARDILQETSLALYRKADQFDPARPFLPWAYRFAYLQVQKHREKAARSPLLFSEDVIESARQRPRPSRPAAR
jgi:RNA polymerase sigma-70 factor, ECF subfamily